MKRNTPQHPKVDDLIEKLGIPRYAAVGLLEGLWHITAASTPEGDIGRFSNMGIAKRLEWEGDADELINAMCDSQWLDRCEEHRLIIHDWPDHAEDAVHMRLGRSGKTFADGTVPNLRRMPKDEREKCLATIQASPHTESTSREHAVHTPPQKTVSSSATEISEPCTQHVHGVSTAPAPAPASANAIAQAQAQTDRLASSNARGREESLLDSGDRGGDRNGAFNDMAATMSQLGKRLNLHHGEINQLLINAGIESNNLRATISQRKDLTPDLVKKVIDKTRGDPRANDPVKLIAHRLSQWTEERLCQL